MVTCKEVDIAKQAMDSSGHYILIRVDFSTRTIGARIMSPIRAYIEDFCGRQCQDVYHAILNDERATRWFTDLTHVAYLGKELKKAEIALATGGSYYQE